MRFASAKQGGFFERVLDITQDSAGGVGRLCLSSGAYLRLHVLRLVQGLKLAVLHAEISRFLGLFLNRLFLTVVTDMHFVALVAAG